MLQNDRKTRLPFQSFLRRFFRGEDGLITVESMLILPMLFWAVFATYTFYDSYRQSSRDIKGAYAIADIISREQNELNSAYLDTLYDLYGTLVSTRSEPSMRITYLIYDIDTKKHDVVWSCVRGKGYQKWNNTHIELVKERIPTMPDNGRMILVETSTQYQAPFRIGFGFNEYPMGSLVFTHPRILDNIKAPSCAV